MKDTTIKSTLIVVLVGLMAGLLTACGGSPSQAAAQPARVVTATPSPISTVAVQPEAPATAPTPLPTATPLPFQTGSLLQSKGKDVFYLTEAGTRQGFHNWETLLAFGFAEEDIVTIDNEALESIPLAGELTRLVRDEAGRLYWAADGHLWRVDKWEAVVSDRNYAGVPVTDLDHWLQKALPAPAELADGTLLRVGETVYYLDSGTVLPLAASQAKAMIDVPPEVLAAYQQQTNLDQLKIKLNTATQAANLRQGPGLDYAVVTVIRREDGPLQATGRTADGHWLWVTQPQGEPGWLAADLVEPSPALQLLGVPDNLSELVADVPLAEPTPVAESEPQSLYCYDTPIRGFGKVWGEHPEVQAALGCPAQSLEQGTNAAVQHFQHGVMLWLEADTVYSADPVYVLFDDGSYQRFGDLGPADLDKVGDTPAGFFGVGDRFSKVYWEGTGSRVKERLGYAISEASDSPGAFQQFYYGRMFWLGAIDRIFILYDYFYYDANGNYVRTQSWQGYEDTF